MKSPDERGCGFTSPLALRNPPDNRNRGGFELFGGRAELQGVMYRFAGCLTPIWLLAFFWSWNVVGT